MLRLSLDATNAIQNMTTVLCLKYFIFYMLNGEIAFKEKQGETKHATQRMLKMNGMEPGQSIQLK